MTQAGDSPRVVAAPATNGPGPVVIRALSLLALLVLWVIAATLTADPLILPQPWAVLGPVSRRNSRLAISSTIWA